MSEGDPNDQVNDSPPPAQPAGYAAPAGVDPQALNPAKDEMTMGMLCHLLGLFTGFVGPLVVWLIKKDQSAFVNDQGKEALNFQITMMIGWFAAGLLTYVAIGCFLYPVLLIYALVVIIKACMAASNGQAYRYPITLRLIK